jgi:hypothetical protein
VHRYNNHRNDRLLDDSTKQSESRQNITTAPVHVYVTKSNTPFDTYHSYSFISLLHFHHPTSSVSSCPRLVPLNFIVISGRILLFCYRLFILVDISKGTPRDIAAMDEMGGDMWESNGLMAFKIYQRRDPPGTTSWKSMLGVVPITDLQAGEAVLMVPML